MKIDPSIAALKADNDRLRSDNARLRAAFLQYVKDDNKCWSWENGKPCHAEKCGCLLEMQQYIDATHEQ